jgi:hypothetical protein
MRHFRRARLDVAILTSLLAVPAFLLLSTLFPLNLK